MARFPSREADVIALVDEMIGGYLANPGVFPGADVVKLQGERAAYGAARDAQMTARAQYALTTETKEDALAAIKGSMRHELRKSETDVVADPQQLKYIGWGPRRKAEASDRPGQPRSLDAVSQGQSSLHLDWKCPAPHSGGHVLDYIVERRELEDGAMNMWHTVASSIKTEIQLEGQPRGVSMEYRVVANNVGGRSDPSNAVDVVL